MRFGPIPDDVQVTVTPNLLTLRWQDHELAVAAPLEHPAIIVRHRGLPWQLHLAGRTTLPLANGYQQVTPDGAMVVRASRGEVQGRRLALPSGETVAVIGVGEDSNAAETACQAVLADPLAAWQALADYQAQLRRVLVVDDPLLESLFVYGLHAALSCVKRDAKGNFAGIAAGIGYAMPARSYFRDSYWTLQVLLPLKPELALKQLRLLSRAVHPDGEAPSGVIVAGGAAWQRWEVQRAADPALLRDHPRPGEWWADHFDSPLYYCLLACEVAAWLPEAEVLALEVDGRTVRERLLAILARYARLADASGLPVKPHNDRDWADNVFRSGYVTYNLGLYYGALVGVAQLLAPSDPDTAQALQQRAQRVARATTQQLWLAEQGYFAECRTLDGRLEDHLAIDTLTALRYGLASERQARSVLRAMRQLLETRHNPAQPYGDWGVMSVFPPYQLPRRGKSAFAYRYHNGSDWPYWDGVYAEALLKRRARGWRYPLTRWWRYSLAQGWPAPVEYYAPPWGVGSRLNGWSSMPAAAMLLGGFGLTPGGGYQRPPWGRCTLSGVRLGGKRAQLVVTDNAVEVAYG